jgi:hypothetical protein
VQQIDGRMALNDDPEKHRGRQRPSRTDGNSVTVEDLIREDRRVEVHDIAEVIDIAKKSNVHQRTRSLLCLCVSLDHQSGRYSMVPWESVDFYQTTWRHIPQQYPLH